MVEYIEINEDKYPIYYSHWVVRELERLDKEGRTGDKILSSANEGMSFALMYNLTWAMLKCGYIKEHKKSLNENQDVFMIDFDIEKHAMPCVELFRKSSPESGDGEEPKKDSKKK